MFGMLKKKKYILLKKTSYFFMMSNREKLHYLAVKKLLALLKGITSKYHDDFYWMNCFHFFFTTENKLQLHKSVSENKDFCNFMWFL